jgi:antimicrobial peptide system SdpB family protein
MLTSIGTFAKRWAASQEPWTNVYGLARTLLALGTATTLALTHSGYLFLPASGVDQVPLCTGVGRLGAFCLAGASHLEPARWLAVAALLVIASGWRPRVTALLHWWLAFSFQNNGTVLDGGDQVTLVLTALLLPVALTDRRKWHWDAPAETSAGEPGARDEARRLCASFALALVRLQVAGIYFHAAIAKFGVEEWADGTAVYYFCNNPMFGTSPTLLSFGLGAMLKSAVVVCGLTWGVLVLEYALSAALFFPRRAWPALLVAGISLHAGIILLHGLVSFGLAMFAALVLYLRPVDRPFRWTLPLGALRSWAHAAEARMSVESPNSCPR